MKQTIHTSTPFLKPHGDLLEAIIYDPRTQSIYYIDVRVGKLYTLPVNSSEIPKPAIIDISIGVIGLTSDENKLVCGVSNGIKLIDLKTDEIKTLVNYPNNNIVNGLAYRSNDGSVSPNGSFWVGTMGPGKVKPNLATMYEYNGKELTELWSPCCIPNGLSWDLNRRAMYWTESGDFKVYKYDWDNATGAFTNKKDWYVHQGVGHPDGCCIDEDGNLYVCIWGQGKIVRVNPDGEIDMEFTFPANRITCCTIGGLEMNTLYVTTAMLETPEEIAKTGDLGGSIFKVELKNLGIKGVENFHYKL